LIPEKPFQAGPFFYLYRGMHMKKRTWIIALLFGLLAGCGRSSKDGERLREFANELYNRELYVQAVREYQNVIDNDAVHGEQKANITFTIGQIYFERLHDYENAMAAFLKLKSLYPKSPLIPQADQRIVACLERLERPADAKQALDEATGVAPAEGRAMPGKIIAKIGDRPFTSGDLAYKIKQLPAALQDRFKDRQSRLEFLRQNLATELFYDAAKRKGLENDKDVVEAAFQTRKNMMVQKYLEQEISGQIRISSGDVQTYYRANSDRYAEKDAKGKVKRVKPLEEVRQQAAEDLAREKQMEAYRVLIERMMTAEKVVVYDDLVE
jgi:tetratricopeptide (TPR) repeat protein